LDRIDREDGGNKIPRNLNNKSHDIIAEQASAPNVPVPQNLSVKCSLLSFVSSIAFSYYFHRGFRKMCANPGPRPPWLLDVIVVETNTCGSSNICGTNTCHTAGAWNFEVDS
jgi:hypothetical protein